MTRRTLIQARREERRSKHADPPQASIHSSLSPLVCPCVGVFGFVVSAGDFVVDLFLILSVGVCVSEEEADDEGVGFADGEERGKKERN